jgi:uncharacterized protein YgbK (DUF1537 family)
MFSVGLLLSAGGTIALAVLDKALEESGFHLLGTILKIGIPLAAMALGVYFLQTNPILRWL